MNSKKKARGRSKSSYTKHLLQFIDQYIADTGIHNIDMRLVAAWAIGKGLWHPQPEDKIKRLARDLSRAARQDYILDDDELPVRHIHAYKVKQGEVQLTFWVMMEEATPSQMRNSAQLRRNGFLSDAIQLDRDVRHYNKHYNPGDPIEVEYNLFPDVDENRHPGEYKDAPPPDDDDESSDVPPKG
jgi:hypothetical protein